MKRGWITWDQAELPRAAFDARLAAVGDHLAERDLPALVVYTDIWKSNRARHFSNFMPYWNRALLLIARQAKPVLLCGLSPRVYPWIRSVTILEEILPSPDLAKRLVELCSDKGWKRIGVLDLAGLPYDLNQAISSGPVEAVDVSLPLLPDEWELGMYRHAAKMAREGLREELAGGVGLVDHEFTGLLERKFRRAGAEDLVVLLTNGKTVPMPARGEILGERFSVALALEYRGHWVKVVQNPGGHASGLPSGASTEVLSGPYPYESGNGALVSARWETLRDGVRLFFGDTYWRTAAGVELV